mmetsp:Transcript_37515/g.72173  ORF Transcript_37515/g.72173 Transcript_37515/m.72173 type:complete len:461 (-) Transcript_37515:153-1535(-)
MATAPNMEENAAVPPAVVEAGPPPAEPAAGSDIDPERQPLLGEAEGTEFARTKSWWQRFSEKASETKQQWFSSVFARGDEKTNIEEEWDSTQYDITQITSWTAFTMVEGCAWDNVSLWKCTGQALIISCLVTLTVYFIPDAVLIKPEKIEKLGTFLNVFVGLLLGFFLSSSMNRWWNCVTAFLELLDAVRSMQMQMTALGVSQEKSETLSRYGILSAWLLHLSLNLECVSHPGEGEVKCQTKEEQQEVEKERTERIWKKVEELRPNLVKEAEKQVLMQYSECYALLWTWVASLIGRMSQDGEIPPMPSPTYGRILNIVQQAYGSIRDVRAVHLIKAPFIYIHTLAILVHVNNILNAISFGLILGIAFTTGAADSKSGLRTDRHWTAVLTSVFMSFCTSMLAPILYLALLEVSVCVAQPFTYADAKIPGARFIRALEEDLTSAADLSEHPPLWQKPCFKVK